MFDFAPIMTGDRGCGKRKDGGLYACCGLSPIPGMGTPVEDFIIDPPVPWTDGPFRGVQFRHADDGVDMIIWVGAENYPTVPDFVEEGRAMGFCKRIPTGTLKSDGTMSKGATAYDEIIPYVSRMFLVHPRAIVESAYELQIGDRSDGCVPNPNMYDGHAGGCDPAVHVPNTGSPCTFATWDLSAAKAHSDAHAIKQSDDQTTVVETPSVKYHVRTPVAIDDTPFDPDANTDVSYSPGIFIALPIGHFEYVNADGSGDMPAAVANLLGDNVDHTAVKDA